MSEERGAGSWERGARFAGANFTAGGRELLRIGLGKPATRFWRKPRELEARSAKHLPYLVNCPQCADDICSFTVRRFCCSQMSGAAKEIISARKTAGRSSGTIIPSPVTKPPGRAGAIVKATRADLARLFGTRKNADSLGRNFTRVTGAEWWTENLKGR